MPRILGIETSCDETAVAIVDDARHVRCNLVAAQLDLHAKYGGVVPELAARAHLETLDALVAEALETAGCGTGVPPVRTRARRPCHREIDAIAVTHAPGLIGALLIGVTAAKTLAWSWRKPLVAVNHVHAHAASATLELDHDPWPAVALVVSGGHTALYEIRDYDDLRLLGGTVDDAAGEAFDKVAGILGLGYPGGPIVDRRGRSGDPRAVAFPRAMLDYQTLDFSFSGLKTAVLYHVHGPGKTSGGRERLRPADVDDICASFTAAVVEVLVEKTMRAAAETRAGAVVVGGGVAANSVLRAELQRHCLAAGLPLHLPRLCYCTDNGAMIAALGDRLLARGHAADLRLAASASGRTPPAAR
jgi:N6-L-threonylcarbamoyladenine synthase